MPDAVFVDASAWVALSLPRDKNHEQARTLWEILVHEEFALLTTNWTLYEAATILNRHRHDLAVSLLDFVRSNCDVTVADTLEEEALRTFESHADKAWSVVDCANFVAMRENQCTIAFAFDDCFRQAQAEFGFKVLG